MLVLVITAMVDMILSDTVDSVMASAAAMVVKDTDTRSLVRSLIRNREVTSRADYLTSVVAITLSAATSIVVSALVASAVLAAISSAITSSMMTTELIGRKDTRNAQTPALDPADPLASEPVAVLMTTPTIILMKVTIRLITDVLDKINLVRVLTLGDSISTSCLKALQEVLSGRLPLTTSTLVVSRQAHTPV